LGGQFLRRKLNDGIFAAAVIGGQIIGQPERNGFSVGVNMQERQGIRGQSFFPSLHFLRAGGTDIASVETKRVLQVPQSDLPLARDLRLLNFHSQKSFTRCVGLEGGIRGQPKGKGKQTQPADGKRIVSKSQVQSAQSRQNLISLLFAGNSSLLEPPGETFSSGLGGRLRRAHNWNSIFAGHRN
jgi:hypothetical protein